MLTYADVCRILVGAKLFGHALCRRMLTYADVCRILVGAKLFGHAVQDQAGVQLQDSQNPRGTTVLAYYSTSAPVLAYQYKSAKSGVQLQDSQNPRGTSAYVSVRRCIRQHMSAYAASSARYNNTGLLVQAQ